MSEYEGGIVDQVEEWFEGGTEGGDDMSGYDCGGIIEQPEGGDTGDWGGECGGEIPTVWVDEQGNEIPAPDDFGAGTDWTEGLSMGLGPEDGENGQYFN